MGSYALVLATEAAFEPREVAKVVAACTGRTSIDAMQHLFYGRGLLAEHLTAEQAQEIGRQLATLALPTLAVPAEELQPVVRPLRVTKAVVSPGGFEIEDQLQRRRVEGWAWLRLVATGAVQAAEGERHGAPLPLLPGERQGLRLPDDDEQPIERRHYLDLVFGEQAPRHYRIDAGAFNYQYLGADGRLSLRRDDNFIKLVADVVAAADGAWVTPAARAVSVGELAPGGVVADLRLYDAELRWRLQRLRALGQPDEPS